MNAYRAGMLDESVITASCERLFTTRFLLGMFDKTEFDNIPFTVVVTIELAAAQTISFPYSL